MLKPPPRPLPFLLVLLAFSLFASSLLASPQASAETFVFTSTSFFSGATGPSSGTLVTAPGTGGPGQAITQSDIVSFEFSHTFAPGTVIEFDETHLVNVGAPIPLMVAADGSGLESGGFQARDPVADTHLRMVANVGDVNDNYVIDSPIFSANGAFGGAFGGWVRVESTPVPVGTPLGRLLFLAAALGTGAWWLRGRARGRHAPA
ncbi:MAG: hypothetical protein R3F21_25195 [Myxococcota bacterium]